ncbi:MAG: GAF domain-containing protein [Hyphomicrobiales bacterium]
MSTAGEFDQRVDRLERELGEARAQQAATSNILKVISRSTFDLPAVLTTLIQSGIELCNAARGVIWLKREGGLVLAAQVGYAPEWVESASASPITIAADAPTTSGRVAFTGEILHVEDIPNDPRFRFYAGHAGGNYRTGLTVPLKRDGLVVGVIALSRPEAKLFTDRQVELIQTFADQAVIAIENTRLFEEVTARTNELSESLQQQTATADVLKVISRSAFDLQAVLDTLVESVARLCEADHAWMFRRDGEKYPLATSFGFSTDAYKKIRDILMQNPIVPGRGSATARAVLERKPVQIVDATNDPDYRMQELLSVGRYRTAMSVPLLREGGDPIGIITVTRWDVRPFTEKQIELVKTFADQAVIAIENVRLFEEVQTRNRELTESLERQTAMSAILRVISSSPDDLQPVFETIAESAARLCNARFATVYRFDGELIHFVAQYGLTAEAIATERRDFPMRPGRASAAARAILNAAVEQIPDVQSDPDYQLGDTARSLDARSTLAVPILRNGHPVGSINIARRETGDFPSRQIELLRTFSDQAVIAIENVRLFDEVQARTRDLSEALQQQTATADVLKVISRSAFDLNSVLQTLIESAASLCGADASGIYMLEGDVYRLSASVGASAEFVAFEREHPNHVGRDSFVGRTALEKAVVHIPDAYADSEHATPIEHDLGGYQAALCVPLMREGTVIGVFALSRKTIGYFTPRQVELVEGFADQAVIAIENVRLFQEVQSRTAELSEALQQQTATADVLKVISRSAFDLQAVFQALIESAVRLCAADRGVISVREGDVFRVAAGVGQTPEHIAYEMAHPHPIGRGTLHGRAALEQKTIHVADVLQDPEYERPEVAITGNFRAVIAVPIRSNDGVIGVFGLGRAAPGPFAPRQIELVETFADQAAIAIANVRLFDEVEARTQELAKSLEELRAAQDRLVQTEKLASLGQLTAGIAHEIKNPLNFVNNFAALSTELIAELREELDGAQLDQAKRESVADLTDLLKSNLEKVVQHGKRADSIVKNMLLHSRSGSGERRLSDVNAIVEEALNLAYHGARAENQGFNITLERAFDPAAGKIDLFPQEITRVLLNLISNGFYAASKRRADAGDGYEPKLSAATRNLGNHVEIRIRDNGTGIPREVKDKMFNPFFTTKPAGEGTGLGLSLSHDIVVKQHAGTIEVDTEPGSFTEFRIVLPRGAASQVVSGVNL